MCSVGLEGYDVTAMTIPYVKIEMVTVSSSGMLLDNNGSCIFLHLSHDQT